MHEKAGAVSSTRGALTPHCEQSQGASDKDIARISIDLPGVDADAPAMIRLLTTARPCTPQRERNIRGATMAVMIGVSVITNRPLICASIASVSWSEPIIQSGKDTPTSRAPKIERQACCRMRLRPQVASSVSSGRL